MVSTNKQPAEIKRPRPAATAILNQDLIMLAHDLVLMGDIDTVAEKYNLAVPYIRKLMVENKDFKQVLDDFCNVVLEEVKTSIVSSAPEALQVVKDIMKDTEVDTQYRLRAAQDILNRAGAVSEKDKQKKDTIINIVFNQDMFGEADRKEVEADFEAEDVGEE